MSDIEIEIDGQRLPAKLNSMVIQVADDAGIYIPRFCYHKHLSVAANCRMCLVEMEKSPKAVPACATPVMPGMKIFTRSPKALAAQKAVMEFLLINHPLDCPICDQGGECELQDISMGYGSGDSHFSEKKRAVHDQDIGPLIETEMTRCIQCTRCVRFGAEVAGLRELGGLGRGEHLEIGTLIGTALQSEVSGNIIDLCPVGALTSKPFRFSARAWELTQAPSISPHDGWGTHINVHTRQGEVMRVVSRENVSINETWIADRDRYSYEGLHHADRLTKPLIRVKGMLQETDWHTALEMAANQLGAVVSTYGADDLGALASPSATTEEYYLLQKMMRQLGSDHIDHRLRQIDFADQDHVAASGAWSIPIAELEASDTILLVGSSIEKEQPLAAIRLRKAIKKGATVMAVNMMDYDFHFKVTHKKIAAPHYFLETLAGIAKALVPNHIALSDISATQLDQLMAEKCRVGRVAIIVGASAFHHPEASLIRALVQCIASVATASICYLPEGGNTVGATLAGCLPHRTVGGKAASTPGQSVRAMLDASKKGYVLLNVEPEGDVAGAALMTDALAAADSVIALSVFRNPVLEQYADVILPVTPFTEMSGTFVNVAGTWQTFQGVAHTLGEARPGWKVLRVLGNLLDLEGFDYTSSEDVLNELKQGIDEAGPVAPLPFVLQRYSLNKASDKSTITTLSRIGDVPLYSIDGLVRRAASLQAAQSVMEGDLIAARMHPDTADALSLLDGQRVRVTQKNQTVVLPVLLETRVPVSAVFVAGGMMKTSALADLFGAIEITPVEEMR